MSVEWGEPGDFQEHMEWMDPGDFLDFIEERKRRLRQRLLAENNHRTPKGSTMAKAQDLITAPFRGFFVTLDKPRAVSDDSDKEQYSILAAFPRDVKASRIFAKKFAKLRDAAMVEKFGKVLKSLKHTPVFDGDTYGADAEGYDAATSPFPGHDLYRFRSNFKPQCLDLEGNDLLTRDELYSGAWYRAAISIYCWSHKTGGKGFSIELHSVLKLKDDERIGGSGNARKQFAKFIKDDEDEE